jgi:heme/copper-type cytochrome/quinol oxidase subunit 2
MSTNTEDHATDDIGWTPYDTVVGVMLVVLLLLFTFPVYGMFANTAEPILLGMPFTMFWIVLWTVVEFVGLAALYFMEFGRGGEQS